MKLDQGDSFWRVGACDHHNNNQSQGQGREQGQLQIQGPAQNQSQGQNQRQSQSSCNFNLNVVDRSGSSKPTEINISFDEIQEMVNLAEAWMSIGFNQPYNIPYLSDVGEKGKTLE